MRMIKKIGALALALAMALTPVRPVIPAITNVEAASTNVFDNKYIEIVNSNVPDFTTAEKKRTDAFETYSSLDTLGRCGVAYANLCQELMPTGKRGDISSVHPSGWQSNMGWERAHLIAWCLAGENANKQNLISGTRQLNGGGMLPLENMVADYIKETNNHVLYRITPVFEGDNLIASGVKMEAWSVEDAGDGICFNVYIKNAQEGKTIDYKTGIVTDGATTGSTSGSTTGSTSGSTTGSTTGSTSNSTKKNQSITGGTYSMTYSYNTVKSAAKNFNIGSKAKTTLTYKKKSGSSKITVSSAGKVTVSKGITPGTYKVVVSVQAKGTSTYNAATVEKTLTVQINKINQSITGGTYTKTYKASTVKYKDYTFNIKAKSTSGKLTYKKTSGSSRLTVDQNGKVTIKKGTTAGTYTCTLQLTAASTSIYNQKTLTKTLKVVIKK